MDRPQRRKLLVASLGIASISYVLAACAKNQEPVSGNLPAPPPTQEVTPISGNLPAPEPVDAAPPPATSDATSPPAPKDAGGK